MAKIKLIIALLALANSYVRTAHINTTTSHDLFAAIEQNNLSAVQAALDAGANYAALEKNNTTPLMKAAKKNNCAIIGALIKAKACVNQTDMCGNTPLMYIAHSGSIEATRLLLNNNANPDQANTFGHIPLGIALQYNHFSTAQLLIEGKANVNKRMDNQRLLQLIQPLYPISDNDNNSSLTKIIELLVFTGADTGFLWGPENRLAPSISKAIKAAIDLKYEAIKNIKTFLEEQNWFRQELLADSHYLNQLLPVIDLRKLICAYACYDTNNNCCLEYLIDKQIQENKTQNHNQKHVTFQGKQSSLAVETEGQHLPATKPVTNNKRTKHPSSHQCCLLQ